MSDTVQAKLNAPEAAINALLPWESQDAFLALFDGLHAEYQPRGSSEAVLVERLCWIIWKRQRIMLAERAAHLVEVSRHIGGSDGRSLAKRALVASGVEQVAANAGNALETLANDDIEEGAYNDSEAQDLAKAVAILEAGQTQASIEAALACLRQDSLDWWANVVADEGDADTTEECAARLLSFITGSLQEQMTEQIQAVEQRPEVRLQVWGQSLDPFRTAKLMELDGELDRQFERTLGMLLKLQALRADGKSARNDRT
ncbi:hypothetical protein [uncultured Hyphomonas sp.]|jgi:hypothetical protein|uniref:hypothetical protein n=1 Tax=uncultured Hyphomonas sp. TaxID=225298 RepID=UPI000C4E6544|nr:hypothetical protein [Hyphomonadaceae bacterium]MBA29044.1 hypothetical protein [Hyphomonadaceae bacterium]|tara:strand:- start:8290 stop:9066 length:777 start_codon:yes stop_codon:yes gene_type:complete